ncbi:hypothetical protein EBB59_13055 [Lysobacter pythonis]|uniref:Lipoprotein n=2 Tax=Solilutibacter pythonis TaxID=2483112 RepID=A0A3M2HIK7_9GAMM|nr:hypothetical protein EBB59_13055 [Lysobacter pythonis]
MLKLLFTLLLVVCTFLVAGCAGESAAVAEQSPVVEHTETTRGTVPPEKERNMDSMDSMKKQLDTLLSPGSSYMDVREELLANGWEPMATLNCKENVVGGDWKNICTALDAPAVCKVCNEMIELSAYSGDGNVLAKFRHGITGKIIEVSAYGMLEDWGVRGEDSRLQYSGWGFEQK